MKTGMDKLKAEVEAQLLKKKEYVNVFLFYSGHGMSIGGKLHAALPAPMLEE